eukprot:c26743_g1_i2 orf=710-901(+)
MQLGYTTVFGWYAAFLYLRTGVAILFLVGFLGFFLMLGPASDPTLYSSKFVLFSYCKWSSNNG